MREPTWIQRLGGLPNIPPPRPLPTNVEPLSSLPLTAVERAAHDHHEAIHGICAEGDCSNDQ